ncbi:hypothetical protein KP509_23G045800 [Ceratopteris richardii]|nr:hypothetical protein KP509_23G045800 [Ceratopteris richardii]
MQAGKVLDEDNGMHTQAFPAQVLPWWGGIGLSTGLPAVSSSPSKQITVESHITVLGNSASLQSGGFPETFSRSQMPGPPFAQSMDDGQGSCLLAARSTSWPASGYEGEQQVIATPASLPAPGSTPIILQSQAECMLPHTQLELGHSMVRAAYPYADPFYSGFMASYSAQTTAQPYLLACQHARMPLPSEMTEEEPVYVNAKQYNGILRRRQSRAKAESENKLVRTRKPYLHESRHLHAMRRARGCGGRFLNTKKKDEPKSNSGSNVSSEGQSSQEGTAIESQETQELPVTGSLLEAQSQDFNTLQGLTSHLMAGMSQSAIGSSPGYCPGILVQNHAIMSSGVHFGT